MTHGNVSSADFTVGYQRVSIPPVVDFVPQRIVGVVVPVENETAPRKRIYTHLVVVLIV